MNLEDRIQAFSNLGDFLKQGITSIKKNQDTTFKSLIDQASINNKWFTPDFIIQVLSTWSESLTKENLTAWLKNYSIKEKNDALSIAIINAGNIPLVGFHDFLCALILGNKVLVKQSSNDSILLPFLTQFLIKKYPYFKDKIQFTESRISNFDAVIATGSNNTSRYFDYYFREQASIIRKNRTSVAVLNGNETPEELALLADDILLYFGLGCRSVSKIYVPKSYDFDLLFKALYKYKDFINHQNYVSNYTYYKSIYLMNQIQLFDNGFVLLKNDEGFSSPIGVLFFEHYNNLEGVKKALETHSDKIQCIVGSEKEFVSFGKSQHPNLWDYSDGIDTINFLLNPIKKSS